MGLSKLTVNNNFCAEGSGLLSQERVYFHYLDHTITLDNEIENSLETPASLSTYYFADWLNEFMQNNKVKNIVLDKVLEQIRDIRPLLSTLRRHSQSNNIEITIIFCKGKSSAIRRYWNQTSVENLINYAGFSIKNKDLKSATYTVFSESKQYEKFLSNMELPKSGFSYLMVTTEHSDYRITGGIGSYVKECEKLYGANSAVLIIDNNIDVDLDKIIENGWFSAQRLIGAARVEELDKSNYDMTSAIVYEAVAQILFYYPEIHTIESQEALLDRSINAKKTLLLPFSLRLVTTCHGASFHLARAKSDMLELEQIHVAYREKRTIEDSDFTVFPTNFLKDSYKKVGIAELDKKNKIIKRLPFDLSRIPSGRPLVGYKRIVYIGKTSSIKGFDIFLNSLIKLASDHPEIAQKIETVTCIVTSTGIVEKPIGKLYSIVSELFNIEIISLSREGLLDFLAKSSEDSLALVTYPGDNHPTVILELMAIGHDFLALNCGGTPELIPKEYLAEHIIENNYDSIINKTVSNFSDIDNRSRNLEKLSQAYKKEQARINKDYNVHYFDKFLGNVEHGTGKPRVLITVNGNTESKEYQNTIKSIKLQTYKNIRIAELGNDEPFQIRLKEGDVLDPECIALMVGAAQVNDASAVISNLTTPVYENYQYKTTEEYDPVLPQIGSIFLQEKYKRRVVALFRVADIKELDAEYGDWELIIALASRNKTIEIVPENLMTVRRNDSEINWSHQITQDTMANLLQQVSKFDTYILYAQLKRLDDLYFGSKLYNHLEDVYIRRDDPSIIHGVTPNTVKMVGAYRRYMPRPAHNLLLGSAKTIRRVGRKIKRPQSS